MSSLKEQRRRTRKQQTRRPWNYGLQMETCGDCDGYGDVEGGAVLLTKCRTCKGRGKVYPDRSKYRYDEEKRTFVRTDP